MIISFFLQLGTIYDYRYLLECVYFIKYLTPRVTRGKNPLLNVRFARSDGNAYCKKLKCLAKACQVDVSADSFFFFYISSSHKKKRFIFEQLILDAYNQLLFSSHQKGKNIVHSKSTTVTTTNPGKLVIYEYWVRHKFNLLHRISILIGLATVVKEKRTQSCFLSPQVWWNIGHQSRRQENIHRKLLV